MSRRRRIIGLAASAAVCGSLVIAAAADGAAATWTGIGPYGGTVEAFAIDPRTPAVVFVGTWHGLFKSTDAGEHWKPVVAGLTHLSIKAVAVDPRDSKVVYAATARRLHRSVDGGETWSEVVKVPWADDPSTDLHGGFEAIAFPSAAPGTILLAGVEGIYRTANDGADWTRTARGQMRSLVQAPSDPSVVYATGVAGVLRSDDAGASWTSVAPADPTWGVRGLVVHPLDPRTVWAVNGGLRKSTDGGATWETIPAVAPHALGTLHATPLAPGRFLTSNYGGASTWIGRSDDEGATWRALGHVPGGRFALLAIDPTDADNILAGAYAHGVFRSRDGGATFVRSNDGLAAEPATAVAVDPAAGLLYAGLGRGGAFRSSDDGLTWEPVGDGFTNFDGAGDYLNVISLAVDAGVPSTVYGSRKGWGPRHPPVVKSTDAGRTWTDAAAGLPEDTFVELIDDPLRPDRLLATAAAFFGERGGVFETVDGGASWQPIGPNRNSFTAFALEPASGALVASSGQYDNYDDIDELHISTDGGGTWRLLPEPSFPITSLAFGASADVIYAGSAADSMIARSADGGSTWDERRIDSTNGSSPINVIAIDPDDPSRVYAGTGSGGLWTSDDAGATWTALTPGLYGIEVNALAFAGRTDAPQAGLARTRQSAVSGGGARRLYAGAGGGGRSGLWRVVPGPAGRPAGPAARPRLVKAPRVVRTARRPRTLTCRRGAWVGATSFKVAWLRDGRRIRGATRWSYRTTRRDRGARLRCRVTARGLGGKTTATSKPVRVARR